MKKRSNNMLLFIFISTLVVMFVLIANVFFVSVMKVHLRSNTDLSLYADSANQVTEVLSASRGNIYDTNGVIIAQDVHTYDIICILDENRPAIAGTVAYVADPEYTASILSPILKMPEDRCLEFLKTEGQYQVELGTYGRNLSKETKELIESYDLPGITFRDSTERSYPLGVFASNLIGFAQSDETGLTVGKMGVELYLDNFLKGINGMRTYQADKNGFILPGMKEEVISPQNGANVYLTIDKDIQEALEQAFIQTNEIFDADRIWGSVMEVDTGKILAWGQSPSFDPNTLEIEEYNNYGAQLPYEPGSTMKTFVYAAAINEGVYDGTAQVYSGPYCFSSNGNDPYRVESGGYACIYNAGRKNYGWVDYDYGLIYSSNTITASVETELITPDIYLSYLNDFGFFKSVDTEGMREQNGVLNFTWPYDKLALCYGQGSTVTMLQMMQAYSAIFSDGTMKKPYFIEKIVDPYDPNNVLYQAETQITGTPITEETAKQVQQILYRVVNDDDGTAKHYRIPETEIIGKTGTTEVAVSGSYESGKTIVSLMSALPADDPKYMVYYCFEADYNPNAHYYTDPIKSILRKVAMLYGLSDNSVDVETTDEVTAETYVPQEIKSYEMANVLNHSLDYAYAKIAEYGANVIVLGSGNNVIDQSPKAGQSITTNQKLFLLTDTNSFVMPDMTGWSRKDVTAFWDLTDLSFKIEGNGKVVSQNIPAGTTINKDDAIEVLLE